MRDTFQCTGSIPAPLLPSTCPLAIETVFEQGSGSHNEDALLCQAPVFAVFDGASSLCGKTYDKVSGAWWAANIARETFAANEDSTLPLHSIAMQANEAIRHRMNTYGVETCNPLNRWSTSMAAVRLHANSLEYVQIGDSLILCITDDDHFLPAPYVNHDRETLRMWQMASRRGEKNVRHALHERICAVRNDMNRTYGALNGDSDAVHFLHSGSIPLSGIRSVVIFTDGLQLPNPSPENADDFRRSVEIIRQSGLTALHEEIRGLEQTDPDCHIFPRFKQHDDIAAISISL